MLIQYLLQRFLLCHYLEKEILLHMTFMHNFKASFHIVLHTKTYTNSPTEHDTQTLVKEVFPLERERETKVCKNAKEEFKRWIYLTGILCLTHLFLYQRYAFMWKQSLYCSILQ